MKLKDAILFNLKQSENPTFDSETKENFYTTYTFLRRLEELLKLTLPLPVTIDGNKKHTKDYGTIDWFARINEEVMEAHDMAVNNDRDQKLLIQGSSKKYLAEELGDVITVCVSYLHQLGYDEEARSNLFRDINKKNFARGYIDGSTVLKPPIKFKKMVTPEEPPKSKLEPAQVIRAAIAALQTISVDNLSDGQKFDIEEAMDHLKAAHDNNYDDDNILDVDDCITQLESLIDNSESFFNDDGDDEVWRDDVRYLEMAIKIIKEWKAIKIANVKDELPKSESITIPSGTKVDKISTSSSKFKSIDNITVYEDGTVIINMAKK